MRSHLCGALTREEIGKTVTLNGWVRRRRDHGGLIFVDLGDYSGTMQVVFVPSWKESFTVGESLRSEYVVEVSGTVRARPDGTINPSLKTGEVELEVHTVTLLSESAPLPFTIDDDTEAKEELRLRYRFLDLRRPQMQSMLRLRHSIYRSTRRYLDANGFCEVETPILTKPTPEGARDFLVPSRLSPGEFYALPQSPQLFKQVLMCSGLDRYYQIVRCFRDEDLRANRQPEFTQIDMELSFTHELQIQDLIEGLLSEIWRECLGITLTPPFLRLSYDEAMSRFGVDAPDMRYEMELVEASDIFHDTSFQVFQSVLHSGGSIKGIKVDGGATFSRREIDELIAFVKDFDLKGLSWVKRDAGEVKSSIDKFVTEAEKEKLVERFKMEEGDIVLLAADRTSLCNSGLAALRTHLARSRGLIDKSKNAFLWVERFPAFEYDPTVGRYMAVHHPFTSPLLETEEDLKNFESDPGKLRARAYDIVLNGQEIGGGSIRIHRSDVQRRVFSLLGITPEEAEAKFGFLLEALSFGAPPHGGIALGLDRIMMILSGMESIRDVIAFPKTNKGTDLMCGAPSAPDKDQLRELGITMVKK